MTGRRQIGVVGAGTMGAGIAQVGVTAGFEVVLHDPFASALAKGTNVIEDGLARSAARGRLSEQDAEASAARLRPVADLGALSGCEVVIEAAPERLELKHELFKELEAVMSTDSVLATNTSSIPITTLAAGASRPDRVVGMHFFNPVPVMRLVEVVPGAQSSPVTIERTVELGRALGKHVVTVADGPGFLVNRCGRAFYSEALRLLQELAADVATIDRICRMGAGFRMGPFELMDLVGVDVNFAVARSFSELSYGEPRWRPSALQARLVASGNLGRKTGRGWYRYDESDHRREDPAAPPVYGGAGKRLAVLGQGSVALCLRERAASAGFLLADDPEDDVFATVVTEPTADGQLITKLLHPIVSCARHSLAFRSIDGVVGFCLANTQGGSPVAELTRSPSVTDADASRAAELFSLLGLHVEWVADGPALILGRILAQVFNEAAFALGEGVGSASDIDRGVKLGLNYPNGPLEWGALLGWAETLSVLNAIWEERREERYRPAPALIAAASAEANGG